MKSKIVSDSKHVALPSYHISQNILKRQLLGNTADYYQQYSLCFSPDIVNRFTLNKPKLKHNGCVNCATWSKDGNLLATAGDDRTVKLWDFRNGFGLLKSLDTLHVRNIFDVKFRPNSNNNEILTTGADGLLVHLHIDHSQASTIVSGNPTRELFPELDGSDYNGMCLQIEFGSPNSMYVVRANLGVQHVDLREGGSRNIVYTPDDGSVRSMCCFQDYSTNGTIIALGYNQDPYVNLFDIRGGRGSSMSNDPSIGWNPPFKKICPTGLSLYSSGHYGENEQMDTINTGRQFAEGQDAFTLSVSGLSVSSDRSELLVSYQGDQIYSFDLTNNKSDHDRFYKEVYGGHLNSQTFLKNVQYFGPRDEYILSGCDTGHLWMWERSTGRVAHLWRADQAVVNGTTPHPYMPIICSYGIDSTAKIWAPISSCDTRSSLPHDEDSISMRYTGRSDIYIDDWRLVNKPLIVSLPEDFPLFDNDDDDTTFKPVKFDSFAVCVKNRQKDTIGHRIASNQRNVINTCCRIRKNCPDIFNLWTYLKCVYRARSIPDGEGCKYGQFVDPPFNIFPEYAIDCIQLSLVEAKRIIDGVKSLEIANNDIDFQQAVAIEGNGSQCVFHMQCSEDLLDKADITNDIEYAIQEPRFIMIAAVMKFCGNQLFKRKLFRDAAKKYAKAIAYLHLRYTIHCMQGARDIVPTTKKHEIFVLSLCTKLRLNFAAALNRLSRKDAYQRCIHEMELVLYNFPRETKALFRGGVALLELNEVERSYSMLKLALKIAKEELDESGTKQTKGIKFCKEIKRKLQKSQERFREHKKRRRSVYKKMFQ